MSMIRYFLCQLTLIDGVFSSFRLISNENKKSLKNITIIYPILRLKRNNRYLRLEVNFRRFQRRLGQ